MSSNSLHKDDEMENKQKNKQTNTKDLLRFLWENFRGKHKQANIFAMHTRRVKEALQSAKRLLAH